MYISRDLFQIQSWVLVLVLIHPDNKKQNEERKCSPLRKQNPKTLS